MRSTPQQYLSTSRCYQRIGKTRRSGRHSILLVLTLISIALALGILSGTALGAAFWM